ncbi:helix-turn-helix transcriptional regulator [Myxococcus llanfairpwllgwyngyllgogerychwyrndrobwllllantysiliogogogochensis]|uniref:Helix-turn-helix transcriptional regulator n=1 Tax=Myxococcus llanfairpwllgwyngyllgogerychwyrndrobwllllantysiliogogogochensis TaxID=2590453 RepID=A0A540WQK2_9BACT|nr:MULTISPECIES: helix-turn-helix transcriptional regulator [Myxococcus]NTX39838.1 helix-turn-helix transcriptional regulator [Myxococcus sp. CA033]TQF10704.1 helix-turn-helix transcriptional regulator [Myxococcus llanfairpwllgwyngyllgogerychwyrndrobwllllantysiliogogogochensis]
MNEELAVTIGAAARAARQNLGLTQAEVAERVGLVPMVYSRLERGKMLPSVPSLYRLCRELGVSPEVMLDLGGESKGNKSRAREEATPELRRLQHLARKLDAEKLDALLHMATVLSR